MADMLVTGGAGFIGANFVRYWRQHRGADRIVVLDALTYAGHRANLLGLDGIEFVHGDIADTNLVRTLLVERELDVIVNFAAETHVDRSIENSDPFIHTNVLGTHRLLEAAKAAWLDRGSGRPHRFHQVSTDEVYGSLGPDDPLSTETSPYAPNSPYAASKAGGDHLVRAYHRTFGLDITTTHCSNNYGPYQFPEKLVALFLVNCLTGASLPVYGDGMHVRDWLHVEDHCRAIQLVLEKGRAGEAYNVGGGQQLPNLAVIQTICEGVDAAFISNPELSARFPHAPGAVNAASACLLSFGSDRPGHDRRYGIDDSKIHLQLGYSPNSSFSAGLAATVSWYIENEEWWRSVSNRYRN
jgi:dTDP-glucose 4,6-dehydratase